MALVCVAGIPSDVTIQTVKGFHKGFVNFPQLNPSIQVRLLLIEELGLTVSEVESVLGSCDLESLVSSGLDTPRLDFNRLGDYFEQVI